MPDVSGGDKKATQQQHDEVRKVLADFLARKKVIDKQLVSLEASIYAFEGSYLEETASTGNIVKGFDSYMRSNTTSYAGYASSRQKKAVVADTDRIFSLSSSTYQKSLQLKQGVDIDSGDDASIVQTPNSASSVKKDKKRKKGSKVLTDDESASESVFAPPNKKRPKKLANESD